MRRCWLHWGIQRQLMSSLSRCYHQERCHQREWWRLDFDCQLAHSRNRWLWAMRYCLWLLSWSSWCQWHRRYWNLDWSWIQPGIRRWNYCWHSYRRHWNSNWRHAVQTTFCRWFLAMRRCWLHWWILRQLMSSLSRCCHQEMCHQREW